MYIPFEIAFEPPSIPAIEVINASIELFFIIDIGLAFRTSYLTHHGEEIIDWRKIAFNYIFRGAFFFDLLSVIPFNALTPVSMILIINLHRVLT